MRMLSAKFVAAALIVGLSGCGPNTPAPAQQAQAPAQPPAPTTPPASTTPSEPLDPFVEMISAERWTVILDKAIEGVRESYDPKAPDEGDMLRADAALKRGAAMVIELRNDACRKKLVPADKCTLPEFPAWTHEPPTDKTPIEEISRRSNWLSGIMDPFTTAGCEAGRKATKDEMFCSVE